MTVASIRWQIERERAASDSPHPTLSIDLDKAADLGLIQMIVDPCAKSGWQCTLFVEGPVPNSIVAQGSTPSQAIDAAHRRLFAVRGLEAERSTE